MTTAYCIVVVTCASRKEAEKIANALLCKKLAACASVMGGVISRFYWKGRIERADEVLLVVKTIKRHFKAVARCVKALHSYEVPEIIAVPIMAADKAYAKWIGESVK